MRRFITPALLALFAALVLALPVTAGWEWCDDDPVMLLDANRVQVIVSIPSTYLAQVDQPIRMKITLPEEMTHLVIQKGPGFNGRGEIVSFKRASERDDAGSSVPVRISAAVGLKGNPSGVPLRLTVTVNNRTPVVAYGDTTGTTILIYLPH